MMVSRLLVPLGGAANAETYLHYVWARVVFAVSAVSANIRTATATAISMIRGMAWLMNWGSSVRLD